MDTAEVAVDLSKICRLCLSEESKMYPLFIEGVLSLANKIMACIPIQVSAAEPLPVQICHTCKRHIDVMYQFKELCTNSDAVLRRLINNFTVKFNEITEIQNEALEIKKVIFLPSPSLAYNDVTIPSGGFHQIEVDFNDSKEWTRSELITEIGNTSAHSAPKFWPVGEDTTIREDDQNEPPQPAAAHRPETKKRKLNYSNVIYDHPVPGKDGKVHQCRVCLKYLINVTNRNRHELEHHPPPIHCDICGKKLTSVSSYSTHKKIHLGLTNFKCRHCGKYLASRTNLEDHEKVHTGEKNVPCPQCDKTFSNVSNLKIHLRFHAGVKRYFCHVCGKGHVTMGNLRLHVSRHSNERRHVCHLCGKKFNGKSELNKHILSHDKEKRFSCSYCAQKLKTANSLRRHVNIQHLKLRPYVCDVCNKDFGRKENLQDHVLLHVNEHAQCLRCLNVFTHARLLKKHKCELGEQQQQEKSNFL